jgi:hypothetical protein
MVEGLGTGTDCPSSIIVVASVWCGVDLGILLDSCIKLSPESNGRKSVLEKKDKPSTCSRLFLTG